MTNWESNLDMLSDTIWLQSGALMESFCNSLTKHILVRGHYVERCIACLSGKWKAGFKLDRVKEG